MLHSLHLCWHLWWQWALSLSGCSNHWLVIRHVGVHGMSFQKHQPHDSGDHSRIQDQLHLPFAQCLITWQSLWVPYQAVVCCWEFPPLWYLTRSLSLMHDQTGSEHVGLLAHWFRNCIGQQGHICSHPTHQGFSQSSCGCSWAGRSSTVVRHHGLCL